MKKRSRGKCKYCGKEYTKAGMTKHLSSCKARKEAHAAGSGKTTCSYFSICIEGWYLKDYWLHIEMPESSTLRDLDQFLRDIWLECCGHLSSFRINDEIYDVNPNANFGWVQTKSMNAKLKDVLSIGLEFMHEYDFGSTTTLRLKVTGQYTGKKRKSKVEIMARNNPIEMLCDHCNNRQAKYICLECIYDNMGLLCEDCAKEHECGEEMLSTIVNSPRCGVCGYEGSTKYDNY